MDVEHEVRVLPVDGDMASELAKWSADGWELVPGVPPITVYHVVRIKQRSRDSAPSILGAKVPDVSAKAFGEIKIDDTKVGIIRDGKIVSGG